MSDIRKGSILKGFACSVCAGLFLLIPGCGGGGGSGGGAGVPAVTASPPPEEPPPAESPPVVEDFGCYSTAPVKTTETGTLPTGVYRGTLVNCAQDTAEEVIAVVDEAGHFRIAPAFSREMLSHIADTDARATGETNMLSGSIRVDGDTYSGSGHYFQPQVPAYVTAGSSALWVEGSLTDGNLKGRWSTESGDYGYFNLPSTQAEEFIPDWEALAEKGVWAVVDEPYVGDAVWIFAEGGQFHGQDKFYGQGNSYSCAYSGQLSHIGARHTLVALDLNINGCSAAGSFSGIAQIMWLESNGDFAMWVGADDGDQRAVTLTLWFVPTQ